MDRRPEAQDLIPHITGYATVISFITLGELLRGARERSWAVQRISALERYLFDNHGVLPYDVSVAREWARLMADCAKRGFTPGVNDAWIAASGLAFDLTIVARDAAFRTMAQFEPRLRVLP